MSTQQLIAVSAHAQRSRLANSARHLVAMVVAMAVGMVTLYPAWLAAVSAADRAWLDNLGVEVVAMATAMTIPMVAWMRLRGHARAECVEMGAAMYAAFALPAPLVWVGVLDAMGFMVVGHVLMVVLMAALVWRHSAEHGRSQA